MMKAQAQVATPNASRYMIQLCKHFQHKVPAEWTEQSAEVQFPFGLCLMRVEGERLIMDCEAEAPKGLGRMREVLDDHLTRFAWREKLSLSWEEQK